MEMHNMANLKALVSVLLTAGLLSAGIAHAADGNPFQSQQLESGFLLAANDKMPEGNCGGDKKMGEGKCGASKMKKSAPQS